MHSFDVIRAWRDEDYRADLSEAQRAGLPQHPAGMVALSDAGLQRVIGGVLHATAAPQRCTEFTNNCPSACEMFSC